MLNSPTINFPDSIILRLSVLLLFLLSSAVQAQTPRSSNTRRPRELSHKSPSLIRNVVWVTGVSR
jgi:hypothetical protein